MNQIAGQSSSSAALPPVSRYPTWFARLPLAPWGWRELNLFGWPLLLVIIVCWWLGGFWMWLAIAPAALLSLVVYFFRDPPRQIPHSPGEIVSPADGTVVEVSMLAHDEFIDGPAVRIGIFLSLFNVHVNRAPTAGRVVAMKYCPGEFLSATRPESAERNENLWIGFQEAIPPHRRFAVRQISGMIARRIVCTLRPETVVTRGEKFGMIKLGSRTELILPVGEVEVTVRPGERVRGGSQVIARWITR
jgi:phosphatidylserine decarboxylase